MSGQEDLENRARSFYAEHCLYLPAILGWFLFSSLLSSYNKVVFGADRMDFPCPLFLTSIHFGCQWAFSYCITQSFPVTHGTRNIQGMTWSEFLKVSIPCGFVTCADIGLSNLALVRITMTFYTMIKASSPIFVVASAFIFGLEKFRWSLIGVVALIIGGEYLTVLGESEFDLLGFIYCFTATVLSGLRWTAVQFFLKNLDPPLKTPFSTMRLLAPSMFGFMFFFSLVLEKPWIALGSSSNVDYFNDFAGTMGTIGLGLMGAVLAISMLYCEFFMILKTNAIVLMICGVLKEMITIFIGHFFFEDKLNAINMFGGLIAFSGVILYKITSYFERRAEKEYESVAEDPNQKSNLQNETKSRLGNGKSQIQENLLEGESNDDLDFASMGDEDDNSNDIKNKNGHVELTKTTKDPQDRQQIV